MSIPVANGLAALLGLYLSLGLIFAVPFLVRGLRRIDPATEGSTVGFRLIIVPGVVALWPMLAYRWATGVVHPPAAHTPHDEAAEPSTPTPSSL